MCLYVSDDNQDKFVKKYKGNPTKRFKVYKRVKLNGDVVETPFQGVELNSGWFKADEIYVEPLLAKAKVAENNNKKNKVTEDDDSGLYETYNNNYKINEGIHAYPLKKDAEFALDESEYEYLIECEMSAQDVIGVGSGDIVATKMWVPASELKRILSILTVSKIKVGETFKFVKDVGFGVADKYMKVYDSYNINQLLNMKTFIVSLLDEGDEEVTLNAVVKKV